MSEQNITTSKDWVPPYTISSSTLRTLASQRIAAMEYRHQMNQNFTRNNRIGSLNWSKDHQLSILDELEIDKNFVYKIIDANRMLLVGNSIDRWVCKYECNVFFDSNQKTDFLNCLESLVFNHDGSVSYLRSAKNQLTGARLGVIEKYRIACLNCMVDDIKNLWPSVSNDHRVNKSKDYGNTLIDYWNGLMKGEFQRLSGSDDDIVDRRTDFYEIGIWPAIEYILDSLTGEERVYGFHYVIEYCIGHLTERTNIYLKLNNDEKLLNLVMSKMNLGALFFELKNSNVLMREVWNDMKHFVTANNFYTLICFSLCEVINKFWDYSYQFLYYAWTNAPNRLRKDVLKDCGGLGNIFDKLITKFLEMKMEILPDDQISDTDSFFETILEKCGFEISFMIWCECWTKIIMIPLKSISLDEVMKSCFNNNEKEIIRFKEREMMNFRNIEYFCCQFVGAGFIQRLENYLNFCSTNVDRVRALKREIIMSVRVQSAFLSSCNDRLKLIGFDKFIDGAFTDEEDARNYKKGLMMSSVKLKSVYDGVDKKLLGVPWM